MVCGLRALSANARKIVGPRSRPLEALSRSIDKVRRRIVNVPRRRKQIANNHLIEGNVVAIFSVSKV